MMKRFCIGVDVGGTSIKIGLFDIEGKLIDKWEIKTRKENNGQYIIQDIADSIKTKLNESELTLEDLTGVGMGIPGPVLESGYVERCVNIGWYEKNPARELSEVLDNVFVKTANDANIAALGESWKGGGAGFASSCLFTLGTGVGGGLVYDEKVLAGSHGMCGEIGHITVNPGETDACNCGNHGCLEQYASATGIVRIAKKLLGSAEKSSKMRSVDNLTAKDVFDFAREGDDLAMQAVDTLGRYLGLALSYVSLIFDPEVFIIGGGVSKAGDILIDVIEKYYKNYLKLSENIAEVRLANLGNDAGIFGAAKLVL